MVSSWVILLFINAQIVPEEGLQKGKKFEDLTGKTSIPLVNLLIILKCTALTDFNTNCRLLALRGMACEAVTMTPARRQ